MNVKNITRLVYFFMGLAYLVAGVSLIAYRTGWLHPKAIQVIQDTSQGNLNTIHIMQEFGSHLLAIGIISLWFAHRYELSGAFHWAMTVAWGAFALVHWFDARGSTVDYRSPLIFTIPFALFATLGLWRWRAGHH